MKELIDPFEYAPVILGNLRRGILLTSSLNGKVNSMTIGWGTMGIEWGVPLFTVFVRENRFTRSLLEQNPEFTINCPLDEGGRKITAFMGTKSGRDMDKIAAMGLHLEPAEQISTPGIVEFPLTLECRVVYAQKQDLSRIQRRFRDVCYPQHVDGSAPLANRDCHTAYYGEIVASYIIRQSE